jgi:hypothetical protein
MDEHEWLAEQFEAYRGHLPSQMMIEIQWVGMIDGVRHVIFNL